MTLKQAEWLLARRLGDRLHAQIIILLLQKRPVRQLVDHFSRPKHEILRIRRRARQIIPKEKLSEIRQAIAA